MQDREHEAGGVPGIPGTPIADPPPVDPVTPAFESKLDAPTPARESVETLAKFIVEETGRPIDVWAIAALLESVGIRDRDAVTRYGRRDVFALAQAVEIRLPEAPPPTGYVPEPLAPRRERAGRYAKIYGRGTFFFIPLLLQLAALLAVGVSQFAALNFTIYQASVVAVAAALSFLVTSGFTQALGYLAPIYIESGKHMLAESVVWTVMGVGAAFALLVGAIAWGAGTLLDAYPPDQLRVGLAYYALLSAQGLVAALLYVLRKFAAMILATIVSLAVAGVLYKQSSLAVEKVHWIALAVAVALQLVVGYVVLHRRAKETRGDMRLARLPRWGIIVRRTLPFGVYGLAYFAFLVADRAVAWAAGDNPLPFWFHTPYELGLDFALGGIVFALAFLEITVEDFSRMLVPTAERFGVDAVREHNRAISQFWVKQLAFVGVLAAVGTWLAVILAVGLHELGALGAADALYDDPTTHYVFGLGLLGYAFLTLGIANSVFVMSLSRPWRAVTAIAPGLVVSLVVGIVLTTHEAYWTAVFGMVAGAFVFAAISSWQTWRTLRRADYYNYAAW